MTTEEEVRVMLKVLKPDKTVPILVIDWGEEGKELFKTLNGKAKSQLHDIDYYKYSKRIFTNALGSVTVKVID